MVVVDDASCLIGMPNSNQLFVLKEVYKSVLVTSEVAVEFGTKLPDWIETVFALENETNHFFRLWLDAGEASANAFVSKNPMCEIILDDYAARNVAISLGLNAIGTAGVIGLAYQIGIIANLDEPLLKIQQAWFHISKDVIRTIKEKYKK